MHSPHPGRYIFKLKNSSVRNSNWILISSHVCGAHKVFRFCIVSYLFSTILTNTCLSHAIKNYLIIIPKTESLLWLLYLLYSSVTCHILVSCLNFIPALQQYPMWFSLRSCDGYWRLFSEKTLALSFEELLEVEKEFELYPAKTVIKVNYYCLQLCSLILPVSVHLDNIHKDRMHTETFYKRLQNKIK